MTETKLVCARALARRAVLLALVGLFPAIAPAQMVDNTQAINPIKAGINKSLTQEVGASRGSVNTPDSSLFIINRDAFRAVRRAASFFSGNLRGYRGKARASTMAWGTLARRLELALDCPIPARVATPVPEARPASEVTWLLGPTVETYPIYLA